ncbi:MAG: glycosyl hydrolase [Acidobacteriota bacterium]|nr:glycosyl hydrolase [Acidobacteriota bacterium]
MRLVPPAIKSRRKFIRCSGLLIIFILPFIFASCERQKASSDTISSTRHELASPPADYRPAPLWVWNDRITVEVIKEQLSDFKDKGFGGVFVHPRPGLITPYLSEEWLALFKEAVRTGQELGLKIWIYDENSCPSGFAGGLVPAALPEARRSGLRAIRQKRPDLKQAANPVCLLQESGQNFLDITDRVRAGEKGWPEGHYWLFEVVKENPSPWHAGFTYVDLMQPGVTQAFIHLTHEAYKKVCGEDFGQIIPGSFEDEAEIGPAGDVWTVNYTPAILTEFLRRRGYDLKTELPLLLVEKGDFRRVRHDFYLTCLELFIDHWSKPYSEYCQANNLIFTGHYWEHDWPVPRNNPDSLALNAYAHQPGIDILMNNWSTSPQAQFGNSRAVRELGSLANQLGRKRTLSETYGASGWDLTFFDQKRIGDWEYALGVNFLNQHLADVTIAGARKRDHPLSFSYHEPWWPAYRLMNDYFSRLSLALSRGEQINRILVIEPTTSAWMYYSPAEKNEKFGKIAVDFQNFVHHLEREQVEYDLGSEFVLKDYGQYEGNKLRIGQRDYDLVVLPPGLENLELPTAELLKNFLKSGGKVISWGEEELLLGGKPSSLGDEFKTLGHFEQFEPASLLTENLAATFSARVKAGIEFNHLNGQEMLFHQRRQYKDGQILFLANVSPDKEASGEIKLKGQSLEKWDLISGQIDYFPGEKKRGWISFKFNLKPGESWLLAVNKKKQAAGKAISARNSGDEKNSEEIRLKPESINRLDLNVLTIDYCNLILAGRVEKDLYFYAAQKKTFNFHGFNGNPWDSSIQFQDNLITRNHFPPGTGFKAEFHFYILPGVDLSSLRLVVERPSLFRVQVNGQLLKPEAGSWWLDQSMAVFALNRAAQTGANTITLMVKPFDLLAELEPVYVLGNFSLEEAPQGFVLSPAKQLRPGFWKKQGLPLYGHRVEYRTTLKISETEQQTAGFLLSLPDWQGAVAEILVNGESAGFIMGQYESLPLGVRLKAGDNQLSVIIYGTLKNTLGPHHLNPPAGQAWPGSFQRGPEGGQPGGSEYNVRDYGLAGDIIISRKKI